MEFGIVKGILVDDLPTAPLCAAKGEPQKYSKSTFNGLSGNLHRKVPLPGTPHVTIWKEHAVCHLPMIQEPLRQSRGLVAAPFDQEPLSPLWDLKFSNTELLNGGVQLLHLNRRWQVGKRSNSQELIPKVILPHPSRSKLRLTALRVRWREKYSKALLIEMMDGKDGSTNGKDFKLDHHQPRAGKTKRHPSMTIDLHFTARGRDDGDALLCGLENGKLARP
jgi:hypothetical protein